MYSNSHLGGKKRLNRKQSHDYNMCRYAAGSWFVIKLLSQAFILNPSVCMQTLPYPHINHTICPQLCRNQDVWNATTWPQKLLTHSTQWRVQDLRNISPKSKQKLSRQTRVTDSDRVAVFSKHRKPSGQAPRADWTVTMSGCVTTAHEYLHCTTATVDGSVCMESITCSKIRPGFIWLLTTHPTTHPQHRYARTDSSVTTAH